MKQTFLSSYWLPILAGIFIGTSYIPFLPWALPFLYLPLWIYWQQQTSLRGVLIGGWITQFVLTLIGFNWVTYTIKEFGHLPMPLAIVGFILFCSFAHLHIPLAGALWWLAQKHLKIKSIWILPAVHILSDLSFPMIFEWHMGYTLFYAQLPVFHLAEWIGFRGLSSLIYILNVLVLQSYPKSFSWQKFKFRKTLPALFFIGTLQGLGFWLGQQVPRPEKVATILVVQANIGNSEKLERQLGHSFREFIVSRYKDLTLKGWQKEPAQLALWPESAFPHILGDSESEKSRLNQELLDFLKQHKIPLATGAYAIDRKNSLIFNSFFTLDAEGKLTSPPYSKSQLLAFGEYLPGSDLFPILKTWLPQVGFFGRGQGPQLMNLSGVILGPHICYESLFDHINRDVARLGAEILVNVTNDSWYGTWQEPYQHLYMTLARAIEVRRPMVRSTNTGISSAITAQGQILVQSPMEQEWSETLAIPYSSQIKSTLFMSWGYYFSFALAILLIAWTLICPKRSCLF